MSEQKKVVGPGLQVADGAEIESVRELADAVLHAVAVLGTAADTVAAAAALATVRHAPSAAAAFLDAGQALRTAQGQLAGHCQVLAAHATPGIPADGRPPSGTPRV